MDPTGRVATRSINGLLFAIARAGVDLLFPWSCFACGADAGEPICEACLAGVHWMSGGASCPRCGLPYASGPDHPCARCTRHPPAFGSVRAVARYEPRSEAEDPLGRAIRAFKYGERRGVGRFLGRLLAERCPFDAAEYDVIVPIPLDLHRLRDRGFNQAMVLARALSRRFSRPIVRLLRRTRSTVPQVGLDERTRRANLRRAFGVDDPVAARGRRILLVDDVVTTGTTVEACARALLSAGAKSADVVALARTPLY